MTSLCCHPMRMLVLFAVFFAACLSAGAQAWRPADVRNNPRRFCLGVVTGIGVHEVGHVLVATAKGYRVGLHGFSIVYPGAVMSDRDHRQVASAGYQTQWLLAETVLRCHEAEKTRRRMDPFRAGLVVSHLAVTTAYLTVLRTHPEGDLTGISQGSGLPTGTLAAYLALPAALDCWRLCGRDVPNWVPALSLGAKGAGMGMAWTF